MKIGYMTSLHVAVPTLRKNVEGTSTKDWHKSCSVTSTFHTKIYNGSLLHKDCEQYFCEYWLAKIDYLVVLNTEADGMSEATRTWETFKRSHKRGLRHFWNRKIPRRVTKSHRFVFWWGKMSISLQVKALPTMLFETDKFIVSPLIQKLWQVCTTPIAQKTHKSAFSFRHCHSLFGYLTFSVASLVFMKGTSFCVIGRILFK